MEENSDSKMETDVSSTTQDIQPLQDRSGPSITMEVTVEVAETKAEVGELPPGDQDERIDSNTPEKAPPNLLTEQKVPLKVIVIKKAKNPATVVDRERSLLKRDVINSPTKVSLLKAHGSSNEVQLQNAVLKTPEKSAAVSNDLDVVVTGQNSTEKNRTTPVKESTQQKIPEKVSKSPLLQVDAPVKPVEQAAPVVKSPKEVQTSPKASETEEKLSAPVDIQDSAKNNLPDKPIVAAQPAAKQDKKTDNLKKGEVTVTVSVEPHDEKEISDDSQNESIASASNKSISRELKSLINSAKESKIINECTQVKTKTRKSRSLLDSSNTALNITIHPDKPQTHRRESCNSQESSCSEKSELVSQKPVLRMRSQNHESVPKNKGSTTSKPHTEEQEGQVAKDVKKKSENEKLDVSLTVSKNIKPVTEDDVSIEIFCARY